MDKKKKKKERKKFTLALWLNLLSSHFTTEHGPPNGMMGLSAKSLEHTSCSSLKIFEINPWLTSNLRAVILCESSAMK